MFLPTVPGGGTMGLQMDFLSFFSFFTPLIDGGVGVVVCGVVRVVVVGLEWWWVGVGVVAGGGWSGGGWGWSGGVWGFQWWCEGS